MVEGTGLENRQTRKRLEGSNPSPSASAASILGSARKPSAAIRLSPYFKGGRACGSTITAWLWWKQPPSAENAVRTAKMAIKRIRILAPLERGTHYTLTNSLHWKHISGGNW